MIRLLLVEDSPTVAYQIKRLLEGQEDIKVVGMATDGRHAQSLWPTLQPNFLLTDLWMPGSDGLSLIRWVMSRHPVPVLVLSDAVKAGRSDLIFHCLEAGALDVSAKPEGGAAEARSREALLRKIRMLASIKVVRRILPAAAKSPLPEPTERTRLIAVGASTGGPQAFVKLFADLPTPFPVPIVAVQHMEPGFLEAMTHWLDKESPLGVTVAREGRSPEPGVIHFAPDHHHLVLDAAGLMRLAPPAPGDTHVPSIDRLFQSVATHLGSRATGILLTGMGRDGAAGLLAMHKAGARTLAQDEASSVVFGMPAAALDLGAVTRTHSLKELHQALCSEQEARI